MFVEFYKLILTFVCKQYCIYLQPCVEIAYYERSQSSLKECGKNLVVEWKQNSGMLAVTVSRFLNINLLLY